ncbi:hypothetical protein Dimus_009968 [Dionaea muscipula]
MDSSRRHLPPWMLAITAADRTSSQPGSGGDRKDDGSEERSRRTHKSRPRVQIQSQEKESLDLEENSRTLKQYEAKGGKRKSKKQENSALSRFQNPESGAECENRACKPKRKVAGAQSQKKESLDGNPWLLRKCNSKGSKRKCDKQDSFVDNSRDDDDSMEENYSMAEGRFQNNAPSKNGGVEHFKAQQRCETEQTIPSDEELTVEDLVHIAKEYVKIDEDKDPISSCLASESGSLFPPPSSSKIESGSNLDELEDNGASQGDTSSASHSNMIAGLTTKGSTIISSKTGDAAQDMLNLFLGPLLMKSEEVERRIEVICERATPPDYESRDYVGAAVPSSRKSENSDSDRAMPEYELSIAPMIMKKKMSLKDQVAMLLY